MRPKREALEAGQFAYFVSTQTEGRKPFFRHERWAKLMMATLEARTLQSSHEKNNATQK